MNLATLDPGIRPATWNAPLPAAWRTPIAPPDHGEITAALGRILASTTFARARRLRRLLQFLVERRLGDAVHETTEYGIGIEVFDRDPASYSTGMDPIVRVQVGRLRDKLRAYYAAVGNDGVVISIPLGKYMPVICRAAPGSGRPADRPLLILHPLKYLALDTATAAFGQGLGEELSCRLFEAFGDRMTVCLGAVEQSAEQRSRPRHVVEGSVRVEDGRIRASMRLIDVAAGAIAWSAQFDRDGAPGIALQEELARAVCAALAESPAFTHLFTQSFTNTLDD